MDPYATPFLAAVVAVTGRRRAAAGLPPPLPHWAGTLEDFRAAGSGARTEHHPALRGRHARAEAAADSSAAASASWSAQSAK